MILTRKAGNRLAQNTKHKNIMDNTIRISCERLAQKISLKKAKNGLYTVTLTTTKNILCIGQKGMTIYWDYTDYKDALNKYISLAMEQAEHIAVISL